MTIADFMSINAVHNPYSLELYRRAIAGEMTKSDFVEAWCAGIHTGKNRRKQKSGKQGMWQADNLERHFGWIWNDRG